jgi:two-component system CheB/CheR fusion protein
VRIRKDGKSIDVSLTISPIVEDGKLVGLSTIARDETPLIAAQRELELAATRREQFLAMLSHELRNPLAAVLNATNVMEEAKFERPIVEKCHRVVGRQGTHMARLLDDLLDVSRITRGKFELRVAPLDLRQPIEAAIEATGPLFSERGVKLEHSLPDEPMPTRGDQNRLMQVLVNLLSNAANYSPRHSVVRLNATIEDGEGVIIVLDHGVGIELDMQPRIFDLFVQSEQRLDRSRGGLGVGLSLAKSIVELHGGTIEAHSEGPGRGTTFRVRLPTSVGSPPR